MSSAAYIAQAFGWQGIVRARTAREALRELKGLAASASLLRSDITSCRRATDEEVELHTPDGRMPWRTHLDFRALRKMGFGEGERGD